MVGQNQPVSDQPVITDSLTKAAAGGNVGLGVSDVNLLGDSVAAAPDSLLPTVAIDPTFAHLNGRNISRASVGRTTIKEKLAIATVTFPSNVSYESGGMTVDFTSIGAISRFATVYLVSISNKTNALYTNFFADSNNAPSLGVVKFYDNTGTELVTGSLAIQNVVLKCIVRGA